MARNLPAYRRLRDVLVRLNESSQSRDFAVWSNPLVRLGRLIQRMKGVHAEWTAEPSHIYPPQEEDVVIHNTDIENLATFVARCRKDT